MPELPDVEVYKNYLTYTVLRKKINEIILNDESILQCSYNKLQDLKGDYFTHIFRHGKYCFLKTGKGNFLILHFGMTGNIQYYKKGPVPDHTAFLIQFSNGYQFAFINIRKLGKIFFSHSTESFIRKMNLGPDALSLKQKDFIKIFQQKKGIIKSALMNQATIAGIGNIYSDEVLYHSYIHPQRKVKDLEKKDLKNIYQKMQEVFKIVIDKKAMPGEFPSNYLAIRRKPNRKCGLCPGIIEKKNVNGRSCYFCNKHQK
jgi:formamidopyrimidine-DNA glycosylase